MTTPQTAPDGVTPYVSCFPGDLPDADPDNADPDNPAPAPPLNAKQAATIHNIELQQTLSNLTYDQVPDYLLANPAFVDELVDEFDLTISSVILMPLRRLDERGLLFGDISVWVKKCAEVMDAPRVKGWQRPPKSPRFHQKLTEMADGLREMHKDALAALTPENMECLQGVLEMAQQAGGEAITKVLASLREHGFLPRWMMLSLVALETAAAADAEASVWAATETIIENFAHRVLVLQRRVQGGGSILPSQRAERRLSWERRARSLRSCVSSSHNSN